MTLSSDVPRWRGRAARRADRSALGFVRQPKIRWLGPGTLVRAALDVAVSGTFGRLADKREMFAAVPQVAAGREPADAGKGAESRRRRRSTGRGNEERAEAPPPYFDYSALFRRKDVWIDYLSDTGDGFEATYTMAWLLAQDALPLAGPSPPEPLQPGQILLLGGDQVYPAPSEEQYENRFFGPFRAALPKPKRGVPRDLYALPGNHDWYDGLTAFTRTFCNPGAFAGWYGRQTRSYWALKLPHGWWIWAIDVQLDTYIDNPQIEYFKRVGEAMAEGDKLILMTAKPSWVKPRLEPASWRNLTFFEERVIPAARARLALVLTGDLHHYSRHAPRQEARRRRTGSETGRGAVRITAGGGGAYLSGTHTLQPTTEPRPLLPRDRVESPGDDRGEPIVLERRETYPRVKDSRAMASGVFKLPVTSPGFCVLLAAIYALLGAAGLRTARRDPGALVGDLVDGGFIVFLDRATGVTTVAIALLLWAALAAYAEFRRLDPDDLEVGDNWWLKIPAGALHAACHVAAVAALVYAAGAIYSSGAAAPLVWASALGLCAIGGYVAGGLVFAAVLYLIHVTRGWQAPQSANAVFASQGIVDYKNFLRLHLDRDGALSVYALGVDRVCRRWRKSDRDGAGPVLEPADGKPSAKLIDEPVRFDRGGRLQTGKRR